MTQCFSTAVSIRIRQNAKQNYARVFILSISLTTQLDTQLPFAQEKMGYISKKLTIAQHSQHTLYSLRNTLIKFSLLIHTLQTINIFAPQMKKTPFRIVTVGPFTSHNR